MININIELFFSCSQELGEQKLDIFVPLYRSTQYEDFLIQNIMESDDNGDDLRGLRNLHGNNINANLRETYEENVNGTEMILRIRIR